MKFPTMDEFAKSVAEKALDEIEYNGKTIREWIEIILATDNNVGTKLSTNLAEVGTDCISRQAAIDALEKDMASLDHIIKGMSANDVRLDAYVSQRNQVNYDIYTINNLPPELGTNLAEVGTDAISRADAIKIVQNRCKRLTTGCVLAVTEIRNLPPAEPKRGKWVEGNHASYWTCSVCGEITTESVMGKPRHNFCPNCGAKMEVNNESN